MAEEADKFNEAEFLRRTYAVSVQEMERSRNYFETLLTRTFWAVGIIFVVVAGATTFFGLHSWTDVQARMDDKLRETQRRIEETGGKAIRETSETIQRRAEAAFQEESLKKYIREVAKEKTEQQLSGLISETVTQQVASRVKAEEPEIEKITVNETRRALDSLAPTINAQVAKRVEDEVAPVKQQVVRLEQILTVTTAVLQARNGDGKSYDTVRQLAALSPDPNVKAICISTLNQIYLEMNPPIYGTRTFIKPLATDEMEKLLDDANPLNRWAAIDGLAGKGQKGVVPKLIWISTHDNFLVVRRAAFQALRTLTGQNFENFSETQWDAWWQKNKANWPSQ